MAKLGKQKKAYDDSIRDLDDVYFEVQRREEQRREQGLPPLIGVLPRKYEDHFSTPEERWEPDEVADPTPSRAVHSKGRTTVLGPRFCRGTSPRTTSTQESIQEGVMTEPACNAFHRGLARCSRSARFGAPASSSFSGAGVMPHPLSGGQNQWG